MIDTIDVVAQKMTWIQLMLGAAGMYLLVLVLKEIGNIIARFLGKKVTATYITVDDLLKHCDDRQANCFGKRADDLKAIKQDLEELKAVKKITRGIAEAVRIMAIYAPLDKQQQDAVRQALEAHD